MIPLHTLLSRFKGIKNHDKERKKVIVEELKKINIHIEEKNIKFSKNTILIQTSPIIKTEIILIKEGLIESLKKKQETSGFIDIK